MKRISTGSTEACVADHFDIVVGIDSCNSAKPDSKILLHAVSKLHVQPEDVLYVGDSFQYDFEGAKAAGLKPLLVNRNERTTRKAGTMNSLTEVLAYIWMHMLAQTGSERPLSR